MPEGSVADNRGLVYRAKHLVSKRAWRALTRPAAAILSRLPEGPTYRIGLSMRRGKLPYSLIRPGDVVFQIGAPSDLLGVGRSRAAYFLRLVGEGGTLVVMEPDPENCRAFRAHAERCGLLDRLVLIDAGAWSSDTTLTFLASRTHPASAALADVSKASEEERNRRGYREIEVPVRTVDGVIAEYGLEPPRLFSITTNGAEHAILDGLAATLAHRRELFISLAAPEADVKPWLDTHGFLRVAHDDRGETFRRAA